MNTKPPVKLIKKEKHETPEVEAEVEPVAQPHKWAKEVRSWVGEFKNNQRSETLPAFDSLFKDADA